MGFRLNIVVSDRVDAETRERALADVASAWPFCNLPGNPDAYPDRILFAPPELTSYLFDTHEDWMGASEESERVAEELLGWSRQYPGVGFAWVEADCFGGVCNYSGFVVREGERIMERDGEKAADLVDLLDVVGLDGNGSFPPFTRSFFAGRASGRPRDQWP